MAMAISKLPPLFSRLIGPRHGAESNGQSVPSINGDYPHAKGYEFLFIEMFADGCVQSIGNLVSGNQGQGFGPRQCRPFTIRIKWGFAPSDQRIQALFCFPCLAQVLAMHIYTICTSVYLGCPKFY